MVDAQRVILATGAYDRPVAFPGWTLPGVMSAGGAQSLVKIQRVVPGERILMVGSGPLILAFSAQLHQFGANLVGVVEAAPFPGPIGLLRLLRAAPNNVHLVAQGLRYLAYLRRNRVPFLYGHMIARVEGRNEVERAVVTRVDRAWRPIPGRERVYNVDTVCVGYGFFPSVELSLLAGCAHDYNEDLGGHIPRRHQLVRTTVPSVLVAGDGAGVAGAAVALDEGRVAGITAACDLGRIGAAKAEGLAAPARARLTALSRFRAALAANYRIGPGLYELCTRDTIVCRCEEVTAGELLDNILIGSADPNAVRSLTRAGMGQCQGRNCARQVASLVARQTGQHIADMPMFTPRPPAKPVPIYLIAEERPEEDPVAEVG
jgi:NADPH-dependent 2,4-dienoyl-CoA reductase/sulfur reductase-like enzyme